jgi:TPR repeat protein
MSDFVVKLIYDCEMLNYIASFLLIFVSGFSYGQSDEFLEMEALAESGDVEAQFYLAFMYDNGNEVPKNDKTAVKWYTKAAEQGLAEAQFNLGVKYDNGEGVLSSNVKAYMWYNLAAFNGNEIAGKNKDIISKQMTNEQIGRAQDLSEACLAKDYKGC